MSFQSSSTTSSGSFHSRHEEEASHCTVGIKYSLLFNKLSFPSN